MSNKNFNPGEVVHDPLLKALAKRFEKLPAFPDSDYDRGHGIVFDGAAKHISKFPGMPRWAVKHYIGGKNRCLAFVSKERLDDACRFADTITFRFWKYRQRGAEHMNEQQFNFSSDAARQDLGDWAETTPEIVTLIDDIEEHFLNLGLFVEPTAARTKDVHGATARRTIRGEMKSMAAEAAHRHQELLDCIAALAERLDEQDQKLNELRKCMRFAPSDPFGDNVGPNPMFSTSTGDPLPAPAVTICEAPASIFIPPLTGEVRITIQEPPYTK